VRKEGGVAPNCLNILDWKDESEYEVPLIYPWHVRHEIDKRDLVLGLAFIGHVFLLSTDIPLKSHGGITEQGPSCWQEEFI
jgi:hypothetical protein